MEVLAHGVEEEVVQAVPLLDQTIRSNSVKFTIISLAIFLILTLISLGFKQKSEWLKYALYFSFVLVALINTIYLSGSTIYLNQQSTTGGPVHYHADYQIWNCGRQIELADPEGVSNKIGTNVIHEHNDNRIHIEGVILDPSQASLSHFFREVGGSFDSDHLTIPAEKGMITMETGNICPDGTSGILQTFVFKTINGEFFQQKVINPEDYIISPQSQVPPGDCVIFEFGPLKEKTDKLCNFYEIAVLKGEIHER